MTVVKQLHKSLLDNEWVELLEEARGMGLTTEEIRVFLQETNSKQLAE